MKSTWATVTLGDVAVIERRGVVPATLPADTPYIGLEHIESGGRIIGHSTVGDSAVASTKFLFGPEHVLFGKLRPYLGKVAAPDFAGVCSTDILPILPRAMLDRRYLTHFLRQPVVVDLAAARATGANLPRLSPPELGRFELPLPPIEEQRRIAAILDHADDLVSRAACRVTRLDQLVDARFRADFGDLAPESPGSMPLRTFVPDIDNGRSPVCESRPRAGSEYGVLKLGAVTYGQYRPQENKAYLGMVLPTDRQVRSGDLLMTRKNTKDLVGAVAFVGSTPDRLLLPDLVFRLNYDPQLVQPVFMQRLLMTGRMRDAVRGLASGSAASMPNISKARLLALPVPMPSLTQQEGFVAEAKFVDVVRTRAETACSVLRTLFTSLQARAFSGRL